jgi:hypothetical protein
MKAKILLVAGLGMLVGLMVPQQAVAQDGPGSRTVVAITFELPFTEDGGAARAFFRDRFLVNSQLNPNVLNSRVLLHRFGSKASRIVFVREYADLTAVDAPCGQPCADWRAANPAPQEGEDGYEEFDRGRDAFWKAYGDHSDEIYRAPMGWAKLEGEVLGRVGPRVEDDE